MEQYCQQPMTQSNCSGENVNKWKSPSTGNMSMEYNSSGGFDCNICLDLVQDPVVTLCGHLYCWPCIYRWMHSQRSSVENSGQRPECPVCKAEVSQNTLIPLYGRGQPRKLADNRGTKLVDVIPQRPDSPGCRVNNLITSTTSSTSQHLGEQFHYRSHHPFHYQVHPYNFLDANFQSPAPSLAGTTTYISMIEMFSKMIQAGINGNSHFTDYNHANTYSVVTTSSVRGRMHMMHVDRSLSRVVFFLWCCAILCWLLF